jgi:hypothetical protein
VVIFFRYPAEQKRNGNIVNRFEAGQDARVSSVEKMRSAMEAAGVEFIAENGGSPGAIAQTRADQARIVHMPPVVSFERLCVRRHRTLVQPPRAAVDMA